MGGFLDALKSVGDAVNPLSSVVNGVASLGTSLINRHSQKEANKRNAEQNELSREFSAQQAQLDRDFNAAQSEQQNAFNAAEAQKSRVFNADQAKRQMEFQEKMWNAQNEYNDPSAQIARLKAAGINPNWNDGFDNTAGSVSGGAAATSSPASGSPASHGSVGAPSNIPMSPVTIDNPLMMSAQIRLANAQAEKAENDAERTKDLLPYEKETAYANICVANSTVSLNDAKAENLSSSTRLNDQKVQESQETVKFMQMDEQEKQFNLEKLHDRWMMEVHEFNNRVLESNSRVRLAQGQIKELVSRACLNYANAQNAHDIHLLNGLELHFINGLSDANKDYYCKLRWDAELGKYDVDLDSQATEKVSNKRTRQRVSRRNEDNVYNSILDYISDLDDALGRPFGAGFQFGYRHNSRGD